MKALVKKNAQPGLWLENVPEPNVGHNDVLVRVKRAGICGTDLHIFEWDPWAQHTIHTPLVVGHECMGEIIALGGEVQGYKKGERVAIEGHVTCGHCRNCRAGKRHLCRNTLGVGIHRSGCFAEYVAVPASNVFRLPSEISDNIGAFLDPLGNAVHTALSFDLAGEDVLITGAGPIGCMAAAICKHVGARHVVVTDVNDYRLSLAKKMGATYTVHVGNESLPQAMTKLGMKEGFDVGLEMSGNEQALTNMLEAMNYGGHVALLGIPSKAITIDWNTIIFKGLILKGIYGREMFETWYKMATMLQSGLQVEAVLTHIIPLTDFEKAFATVKSGQSGKVVLAISAD